MLKAAQNHLNYSKKNQGAEKYYCMSNKELYNSRKYEYCETQIHQNYHK